MMETAAMVPFAPAIAVRALTPDDVPAACALANDAAGRVVYSRAMAPAELHEQLFGAAPPTIFPVRWQRRTTLGAWRAGELIGFLDAAIGLDSDSLPLPDYQPLGLLRALLLPAAQPLADDTARSLLDAAEHFWRTGRVGHVKAFHASTGYPAWQAGLGLLPGDWSDHVRILTGRDYRFLDRYYCLHRTLDGKLLEESPPQTALTLVFRGTPANRQYQVFFRRTELIGEARIVQFMAEADSRPLGLAHLVAWEVDPRWRNQDIGRWLLRRILNDATQRGLEQVVVFLQMQHAAAMNLLTQHSFVEHAYRGYTLEKALQE